MRKAAADCHCNLSGTPQISRKASPRESEVSQPSPLPLASSTQIPAIVCICISPKTQPWRTQGAGTQLCLVLPRMYTTPPNSPLVRESRLPFPARERATKRRRLRWPSSRSCPLVCPAPAPAKLPLRPSFFPPPTVFGPGSHLSTHSLRNRISSVCSTLGSCLHIFTKARSSLTLRGSMVGRRRARQRLRPDSRPGH